MSYSANVYGFHQTCVYFNIGINYDIPQRYIFNLCNVNLLATAGHYSLHVLLVTVTRITAYS